MSHFSRSDWGARPPRGGPGTLNAGNVEGIAVHWPATSSPIRGTAAVFASLRSWQDYHMDTKGWSDIAYQVAIDQDGHRYDLRGLRIQPGANGDSDVNERFGALLLVLAPGEKPTEAMVATTRNVIGQFREHFPGARRIVGHSQIRPEPTDCPGPIALQMINNDAFEPRVEPLKPPPPTQGKHVDAARAELRHATGEGRRAELIARAKRILAKIPYLGQEKGDTK